MADHSTARLESGSPVRAAAGCDEVAACDRDTDHEALRRFLTEGSASAFASLTGRYAGLVYGVARRRLGHHELAEEVTQDVFCILTTRMMQSMTSHYDIAESVRRLESDWSDFAGLWERRVAAEWSRRDPVAAHAWIDQLPDGTIRDQALAAHGEAVAQRTKAEAPKNLSENTLQTLARPLTYLGSDFGSSPFVRLSMRQLNRLESDERRQLWERAADLPADQRTLARENLVTFTTMTDPHEAATWLQPAPGESPDAALAGRLAANWALDDAPAAARWTTSLPEGEAKKWAIWNLARQWHRVDSQAVASWAESQPASTRAVVDQAVAGQRPDL